MRNGTQPFTVKSSDEKLATVTVDKEKITVTGVATGAARISVADNNKESVRSPLRSRPQPPQ